MRDEYATCPRCGAALDLQGKRLVCTEGCGVLVTEDELRTLVRDMYGVKPQKAIELVFEPPQAPEPVRTCPSCTTGMAKHVLYTIQVDRCSAHGVWFDRDELAAVLAKVGEQHGESVTLREKLTAGGVLAGIYIAWGLARLLM